MGVLLATGPKLDAFEAATIGAVTRLAELVKADEQVPGGTSPHGFATRCIWRHGPAVRQR